MKIIILFLIVMLAIFLRFYNLNELPAGLNTDEVSLGYDAYSILLTGQDQYGKSFPVFLRSFGAYQSPLYAYLTTIPIFLFGLSIFSVRFLSVLVGVLTVVVTFVLIYKHKNNLKFWEALLTSFILSFVPWAVFFQRTAVEASLGLFLTVMAIYFLLKSLQKPPFFILAGIILGLSTHAYQAQRLGSLLLILGFILLFAKQFLKNKKIILIGLTLFLVIQIPQLILINSQAGTRRLSQVNYFSKDYFDQNGGNLKSIPFGYPVYIFNQFSSHYIAYFSPKNLFFDPDPQGVRGIPELSVFYNWMLIPLLFGLKVFWEKRKDSFIRIMFLLMVTSPIPAGLTREPFYTLRVLPLLWVLTIIIALGGFDILHKLRFNFLRGLTLFAISSFSVLILISNYFILLKYEGSSDYGFPFIELAKKTEELNSKNFVIDLGRQGQSYIWFAFFKKYDPYKLQEQGRDVLIDYYNASEFDGKRVIGNVEMRNIDWGKDQCLDEIIVGDELSISEDQIREHHLRLEFEFSDLIGKVKLKGYSTNPTKECNS